MHYETRRRITNSDFYQRSLKKAAKEGIAPPVLDVSPFSCPVDFESINLSKSNNQSIQIRGADFPSWNSLFFVILLRSPYRFPISLARQLRIWRARLFGRELSEADRKFLVMKHYGITSEEYEEAMTKERSRQESKANESVNAKMRRRK
jgi:hypothetical protein